MKIFDVVAEHLANEMPFALYRKPNDKHVIAYLQESKDLFKVSDFTEVGFVFAPFFKGERVYIPRDKAQIIIEAYKEESIVYKGSIVSLVDEEDRLHFEDLVRRCVTAIEQGVFQKVVPSRKESLATEKVDVLALFKRLLSCYSSAFCSVFYHPQVGLWIGATPETLLRVEGEELFTMALAGTQVNHGKEEVEWGQKEIEEQAFVTEFIEEQLQPFVSDLRLSEVYTKRAGKVMHICTDIQANLKGVPVGKVIDVLHPTPAVCGLPKIASRDFLEAEEGYNRNYYSGYLGELNYNAIKQLDEHSDLYVNLRCMQIEDKEIHLYLGCGVTIDSDPYSEFIETVNKSSTMKAVL
ncbi:MAG: chorismate-binding protein [Flavobacteriaceae bacterium]|jgi:isochorismate synthase|nr:chorismate-binding protein [Flavobacteriaceae bacterium]